MHLPSSSSIRDKKTFAAGKSSDLVAGQEVVQALDNLVKLSLAQHRDRLHKYVPLPVAGLSIDHALHSPLGQGELLWQLFQDTLLVKVSCTAAERASHLRVQSMVSKLLVHAKNSILCLPVDHALRPLL